LIKLLVGLGLSNSAKIINRYDKMDDKPRRRFKAVFEGVEINLSIVKNNYICAHFNSADLSMLSDFEDLKQELAAALLRGSKSDY
jgi:hypothetical protein